MTIIKVPLIAPTTTSPFYSPTPHKSLLLPQSEMTKAKLRNTQARMNLRAYLVIIVFRQQMSHNSLLNIQEISSRTFNQEPSIMETSIEHFGRDPQGMAQFMAKSARKSVYPTYEEIIRIQQEEIERYKNALTAYINRIQDMEKGKVYTNSSEIEIRELMVVIKEREMEIDDLKERYKNAIMGLQQTIEKNEMLYREVEKYKKKSHELELNYSREQNLFNKSQNLISNLSVTKSNYEIELVNMKDSLVILEKQNQKIVQTNEEYEEKLALLSQEIQRLRGVSELLRRDNEKYKLAAKEQQEFIQKLQYENHQAKQAIERLRLENKEIKTSNSSLTLQLNEYHEKIMYKQTVINDLQERQNRLTQNLKLKDTQIKELDGKVERYSKQIQRFQDELTRSNNQHFQELGKVRITLNQKANSEKKIEIEKQQIIREYNELILRFESIKREHGSIMLQKESAIKQLEHLSSQKAELIREIELRLSQRDKMMRQNQNLKESLIKSENSFKLSSDQRVKQYEATIRMFQENERELAKDFQTRYENLNEQKSKEIAVKTHQINKLKADLNAKQSQIAQFRSEIAYKSTEIAQLKQSTMSQSTIIDNTKRDYEEKIRERTEAVNELKVKLQTYQKLIQQNRRERDMILQQKNALQLQIQKSDQSAQIKSSELRNYAQKVQSLNRQLRQAENKYQECLNYVENYRRILNDNQSALKNYNVKLRESESSILALTHELERIASLLKEKELTIAQLSAHNRQISQIFQEKKGEVVSLRELNQRLSTNLSRTEQSKSNFQMFMKQIERLNQVVSSKQAQVKSQRLQIVKVIQKIDILYQQQLKIINIIESTYIDDAKRNVQLNSQLAQLKQYIIKLNENTSGTLRDISKQSGSILNLLNYGESQNKSFQLRTNEQLSQAQSLLAKKDQQLQILKREIQDLNVRLSQKQEQQSKQGEIFEKLIELTQQNAAIKQQLHYGKSQHQMEIQLKNQSLIQLQSKVNQFDKKHKKQIEDLKAYFTEKQQSYNKAVQSLRIEKQQYLNRQAEAQQRLQQKQKEVEFLKAEKMRIQKSLDHLLVTINPRLNQLENTNELLAINTREIERYKQLVRNFQAKTLKYQAKNHDNHRVVILQKEIEKLEKILDIRNAQISNNQQGYFKLKAKLNETQKEQLKQRGLIKQLKTNIQGLKSKIKQLQQFKTNSEKGLQSVSQLKYGNNQLHRQLKSLQNKLSESQYKLQKANQQISNLKIELNKILETNSKSIKAIGLFQQNEAEKLHLYEKIHSLQEEIQAAQVKLRSVQIEYEFMRSSHQQTKMHLHTYQFKTVQLQREYLKLKEILSNLNQQNSQLLNKNHLFEIQLKKAQTLQQKIQVLNGEINRLSSQNINLSEEVTSCKLTLSGEHSLQKKTEQQLTLIFLLFAEIESLRNRQSQNEVQMINSSNNRMYTYRQ